MMPCADLSTVSRTPRSGEPGPIAAANAIACHQAQPWAPGLATLARGALIGVVALVSACATTLPQVVERPGDIFDVRYDANVQTQAEADAKANAHCANGAAGYVSQQTGFDRLCLSHLSVCIQMRPR